MARPLHQLDRVFVKAVPRGRDKVAVIQAAVDGDGDIEADAATGNAQRNFGHRDGSAKKRIAVKVSRRSDGFNRDLAFSAPELHRPLLAGADKSVLAQFLGHFGFSTVGCDRALRIAAVPRFATLAFGQSIEKTGYSPSRRG